MGYKVVNCKRGECWKRYKKEGELGEWAMGRVRNRIGCEEVNCEGENVVSGEEGQC